MSGSNQSGKGPRFTKQRRLILLASIGCLLIGGGCFYRYFWLYHPVGKGPAGPSVLRESFQGIWTDRKVLLVGLGDSITAGYGATPIAKSYFNRLVTNPSDEFPSMQQICLSKVLTNLNVSNLAISGSTSIENLEILVPKLAVQDAETFGVVVLTTGGNDIIHNYGRTPPREGAMYGATFKQAQPWIKNYQDRLNKTFDRIESKFPGGCCLFIANIYDPTDGIGDIVNAGLPSWPDGLQILQAYNNVIAECAMQRDTVHLVNIHDAFLGHGIHSLQFWRRHYDGDDPHYWYWDNLEDPNNRGYDAIRRLFLIEMAEVLPRVFEEKVHRR